MIMSILSLFNKKKKKVSPISGTTFTDEDRERSAEIRKMKAERKRILEEIEIEKAKAELEMTKRELQDMLSESIEEESEGSMEDKIMLQLLSMAQIKQQQQQTPKEESLKEEPLQHMTDEEIKTAISNIPKQYLKMAKAMPDGVLGSKIAELLPVDDDTIKRAILILRS